MVRTFTRQASKVGNFGLMDSFLCGRGGKPLLGRSLIPLGLTRSFACWATREFIFSAVACQMTHSP